MGNGTRKDVIMKMTIPELKMRDVVMGSLILTITAENLLELNCKQIALNFNFQSWDFL
jgi:hypothetical protein